jgi:hypothetical protein
MSVASATRVYAQSEGVILSIFQYSWPRLAAGVQRSGAIPGLGWLR